VTDVNDNRPTFLNLPYYTVMSVNSVEGDLVMQVSGSLATQTRLVIWSLLGES
jgi:hypothetical protein